MKTCLIMFGSIMVVAACGSDGGGKRAATLPTPTATSTWPYPTATATPTSTPTPSATHTACPSPSATLVVTPTASATPTPSATPVVSATPSVTVQPSPTPVVSPTPVATPVVTPTSSATPTAVATATPTPPEPIIGTGIVFAVDHRARVEFCDPRWVDDDSVTAVSRYVPLYLAGATCATWWPDQSMGFDWWREGVTDVERLAVAEAYGCRCLGNGMAPYPCRLNGNHVVECNPWPPAVPAPSE